MAKLLIAVVHSDDAGRTVEALRAADLRVTEVPSRGGFLGARNVMLIAGVEDDQVDVAMKLIDESCHSRTENVPVEMLGGIDANWLPTEVTHGGATVFVLPIEQIKRI